MKAGLLLLLFSAPAMASNFATCILDKMPGSANQPMHAAVVQKCNQEHPGGFAEIEQGDGRGLLSFSDGNACTIKKAAGTTFPPSAGTIARACDCLYDKPVWTSVLGEPERCYDVRLQKRPQQWAPPLPEPKPEPKPEPTAEQKHYNAIHATHPDANAIVGTAEFKRWLAGPGKQWQSALETGTADQVIAMFNAYKAHEQKVWQAQEAKHAAELRRQEQVKQQHELARRQQIQGELQAAAARAIERFPYLSQPEYAHVLKQIIETRDQLIAEGTHPSIALTRAVNDHAYAHDPRGQRLPIVEVGK